MILRYRKRHFRIWIVIALFLPLGFVIAWCSIPETSNAGMATVQKEVDVEYTFEASTGSLEIMVNGPILSSGALVLLGANADTPFSNGQIIGQINGSGVYQFSITKDVSGSYLLLYHPVTKERIKSFKL